MPDEVSRLVIVPCTREEAHAFIRRWHRHHHPSVGDVFCLAVFGHKEGAICGVASVGRPVARMLNDGWTLEVTRLATDGTRNAASALYRGSWRAARALGWRRLVTYTLKEEPGTSLRAAGFRCLGERGGGSWSRPSRPRVDRHPLQVKIAWELSA